MNHSETLELELIESTLGMLYPPSFRDRISEVLKLSEDPLFRAYFPRWEYTLTLADVTAAITSDIDDSYLPFAREMQSAWCDYYCFDRTRESEEPRVVVYADDAVVTDWESFGAFLDWIRGEISR